MTDKAEGPGGSALIGSVRPLPTPDLTMPSLAPDGADGAHYYRASTVRALIAAERERCAGQQGRFAGWFREIPSAMSYRLWQQGGHEPEPGDVALYEA